MNKIITIAAHSGSFHADDVFAVAVLTLLYPNANVIRTRDEHLVAQADFAVDVGGVWDPASGRFDHHQKGFAGKRPSEVVYASAGLVWAAHGVQCLGMLEPKLTDAQRIELCQSIDDELVQHLDMADTGAAQGAPGSFGLSAIIDAYNVTRTENNLLRLVVEASKSALDVKYLLDKVQLDQFKSAVRMVQNLLTRLARKGADELLGAELVRNAQTCSEGKILVLPEPGLSWIKVVCAEMPQVLLVVYPNSTEQGFQIRTVPVEPESFKARRDLPCEWAGLTAADLARVTGVSDSVFCHNARFIAGAETVEGALELAKLALE